MKNIKILGTVIAALVIGSCIYAFGSSEGAPKKVQDAFLIKFPNVSIVHWEKESDNEWEAEFDIEGVEYSANFLTDGTWVETEHEIRRRDIPKKIKATIKTEFPKFKIAEAEISETSKGSVYEFQLRKGKEKIEVLINMKGSILQKEVIGEED